MNYKQLQTVAPPLISQELPLDGLSQAIKLRSQGSMLLDLLAPVGSTAALVITRAALRRLAQRFPAIALRFTTAAAPAMAGSMVVPGLGQGAALTELTVAECAAIAYLTLSEVASITTLWASYPTEDEATRYIPAPSSLQAIAEAYLAGDQDLYVSISPEQIAFAVTYLVHCSTLSPIDPVKVKSLAALIGAWCTGYAPAPILAFAVKAQNRLSPYTGGTTEAVVSRFIKDLGVVLKYGGGSLAKWLPTVQRAGSYAVTAYNIGVATYNTAASVCRTIGCPAKSVIASYAVDFLLSPSAIEWRLPFTSSRTDNLSTPPKVNFVDVDEMVRSGEQKTLDFNQLTTQTESQVEELLNEIQSN